MNWFSSSPPFLWQWIGLVAGLAALVVAVMALPTVAQMIWGKPHVRVEFIIPYSLNKRNPERYLECRLTNPPVNSCLLRILGVYRRTAENVGARFHIEDAITHKRIATNVTANIGAEWNITLMPSVSLPATKASALCLTVAQC